MSFPRLPKLLLLLFERQGMVELPCAPRMHILASRLEVMASSVSGAKCDEDSYPFGVEKFGVRHDQVRFCRVYRLETFDGHGLIDVTSLPQPLPRVHVHTITRLFDVTLQP